MNKGVVVTWRSSFSPYRTDTHYFPEGGVDDDYATMLATIIRPQINIIAVSAVEEIKDLVSVRSSVATTGYDWTKVCKQPKRYVFTVDKLGTGASTGFQRAFVLSRKTGQRIDCSGEYRDTLLAGIVPSGECAFIDDWLRFSYTGFVDVTGIKSRAIILDKVRQELQAAHQKAAAQLEASLECLREFKFKVED